MRRSWFKLVAVAAVVLAVSFYAAGPFIGANSQTGVRPGGAELSLVAVTRGTNACFPGGPLDKLFQRLFPGKTFSIGRFKFAPVLPLPDVGHYAADGKVVAPNQAVVWLRNRGGRFLRNSGGRFPVPGNNWFEDVRATIADEQGEEWEMRPGQSRLFPQGRDWNEISEISAWHFPSFPRRGKQIRFRLYGRGVSNHWNLLADFKTANPAPGPYPDWKPMTLPSTVTNRNLRVSLLKLVSGSRIMHYFPGEKRPFTAATFRVEQNGRQTTGWIPQWMDATDATGNEGTFQVIDMGATNGLVFYDAQAGSLSPSEVWRLKMKFKQVNDFPEGRVWTSPELLAGNGILQATNITGLYPGSYPTIHLKCSARSIFVKLDRLPPGRQLTLVGMVDDHDVELGRLPGGTSYDDQFETFPKVAPEVRSVRVSIAASELRSFEFLARPTRE